jgi:anti-sigma regulatory factor (Ser/Thr protein kinase)
MLRHHPLLTTQLTLAAFPTAAACARLHAKQMTWEWGLGEIAETVELLVSELTTNAIKATQDHELPARPSSPATAVPCVAVRLSLDSQRVLVEVWDANPRPPVPMTAPDSESEGGRGLLLVETLSKGWGYYHASEPAEIGDGQSYQWQPMAAPTYLQSQAATGKVVWCEVAFHAAPAILPTEKSV